MTPDEFKKWFYEARRGYFVFENGKVRPGSLAEFALQLEDIESRRVDLTDISSECSVSTVFLGMDHNFSGKGSPILFESLIQGGDYDGFIFRYPTLGHAKKGHWEIVEALKQGERPEPNNAVESVFNDEAFWDLLQEMFEDKSADWWKNGGENPY